MSNTTPPTLTLIRGVPGSGKSYLAKQILESKGKGVHLETDMFRYDDAGNYIYDPSKNRELHEDCFKTTELFMLLKYDVVVANTFVTQAHLQPYRDLADKYDYLLQEIICHGEFENIHDVPQEVIDRMKREFEYERT